MAVRNSTVLILILAVILFGFESCQTIILMSYGMKNPKPIDEKTILHYSKKFKIPVADSYELDTSYISFLQSLDTSQFLTERKNHYQPLQALYFNKTGQLKSYHINCNAGGFPNLHWDRDSMLSAFPPKQQTPVDSILTLQSQLNFLKPLSLSQKDSTDNYDFYTVIYWNTFMSRQSKRLIHFIQDNAKLASDIKVKLVYANNDNIFATDLSK